MAAIELPDRGQPVDISYLYRIVNELNTVSSIVSSVGTESSIKYVGQDNLTKVVTSDLVIYAATQQVRGNSSTDAGLTTRFDYSFKRTPIVTATAQSLAGSDNIYCVVKNISDRTCEVSLVLPSGTTTAITANISIMAIGESI